MTVVNAVLFVALFVALVVAVFGWEIPPRKDDGR